MGGPTAVEVLLALLEPGSAEPVGGDEIMARLSSAGVRATPSAVLARLVGLERSGHVVIQRRPDYRFALTDTGQQAAFDLGPGRPVEVTLVMADLVGFVAYTDRAGDAAAHAAATALSRGASRAFAAGGGEVVKLLGDGVLGTAPTVDRGLEVALALASECREVDGGPWQLRAAVHAGRPVAHAGDLFGADVNLVARLCELAPAGHAMVTGRGGDVVDIRGMAQPVAAQVVAL